MFFFWLFVGSPNSNLIGFVDCNTPKEGSYSINQTEYNKENSSVNLKIDTVYRILDGF